MENEMSKASLYLPKKKHEELKAFCASRGMTVNGLVRVLLDRYMREQKKDTIEGKEA